MKKKYRNGKKSWAKSQRLASSHLNLIFSVFEHRKFFLLVEQIEYFARIDFEVGRVDGEVLFAVFGAGDELEHVARRKGVNPLRTILRLARERATHRVGLTGAWNERGRGERTEACLALYAIE